MEQVREDEIQAEACRKGLVVHEDNLSSQVKSLKRHCDAPPRRDGKNFDAA